MPHTHTYIHTQPAPACLPGYHCKRGLPLFGCTFPPIWRCPASPCTTTQSRATIYNVRRRGKCGGSKGASNSNERCCCCWCPWEREGMLYHATVGRLADDLLSRQRLHRRRHLDIRPSVGGATSAFSRKDAPGSTTLVMWHFAGQTPWRIFQLGHNADARSTSRS
jgi:hypothetical protein